MKKIIYPFLCLLLSLGNVSCSSEDDTTTLTPVFPENRQIQLAPGEVGELSFEANMDWRLTTSKQWFKLIDDQGVFQSLTGKAGRQTIQLMVTDGAYGFAEDQAAVELTMGGETRVVVQVKRPAREREARMYTVDASMNIVQIDEFVDKTFARSEYIGFEANFDWRVDVESLPAWFADYPGSSHCLRNLNAQANQTVRMDRMSIVDVELATRYQDQSGFITIREVGGDYTCRFPISAPGIEVGKLRWLHSALNLRGGWLWGYSGQYLLKDPVSGAVIPSPEPALCKVLTRDMAHTCHLIEWADGAPREIEADKAWIKIEKNISGQLALTAQQNAGKNARKLFLFVVPKDTTVNYASYFNRSGVFTFQSEGFGLQLEQLAKPGFGIYKQINTMKFDAMPDVIQLTGTQAEAIAAKLDLKTLDNIYERVFSAEEWNVTNRYHIAPEGLVEEWGAYELFDATGKSLGNKPLGWAAAEFWAIGKVLDDSYQATQSVVIDKRVGYDTIAEDCLYVVIRNSAKKDIGTFVIRKE